MLSKLFYIGYVMTPGNYFSILHFQNLISHLHTFGIHLNCIVVGSIGIDPIGMMLITLGKETLFLTHVNILYQQNNGFDGKYYSNFKEVFEIASKWWIFLSTERLLLNWHGGCNVSSICII